MKKDIIQSLWIGPQLSTMEQLCISSFLTNGHEFHLYVYDDVKNIPDGTTVCDANEIIDESNIFTYCKGSYAGFSDWFRHAVVYAKGGFWVDMDIICLKPFNFEHEDIVIAAEAYNSINSAVMKFPKGHPFSAYMIDLCKNPNKVLPYDTKSDKRRKLIRRALYKNDPSKIEWGETGGPLGFTRAIKHHQLLDHLKPFTYFYPIPHHNWNAIFDETFKDNHNFFKGSYAVHLWNEMMRKKSLKNQDFDKNSKFPDGSFIEHLKQKYL